MSCQDAQNLGNFLLFVFYSWLAILGMKACTNICWQGRPWYFWKDLLQVSNTEFIPVSVSYNFTIIEENKQTLEEDRNYLKKLMLMDSLQERKMWTTIATLDLHALQDCFSNSKYWHS